MGSKADLGVLVTLGSGIMSRGGGELKGKGMSRGLAFGK